MQTLNDGTQVMRERKYPQYMVTWSGGGDGQVAIVGANELTGEDWGMVDGDGGVSDDLKAILRLQPLETHSWTEVCQSISVTRLADNAPQVGSRVVFDQDWDVYPFALISSGEFGRVTRVAPDHVAITMERHHEGLSDWDNEVHFYTEDGIGFMYEAIHTVEEADEHGVTVVGYIELTISKEAAELLREALG